MAWLSRHCPQAASDLQGRLAQIALIRKAAIQQQPIDLWIQTLPMDDLKVQEDDEDSFDKRPRLSESIHKEPDTKPLDPMPMTSQPTSMTLDDRLVPAGILGITHVTPPHQPPVKTAATTNVQPKRMRQGWLMRVSLLVMLFLLVEGLLAKWLLM
jgi:hypothetical protein